MHAEPVIDYVITAHAAYELERRGLSEENVRAVLLGPGQRLEVRPGRVLLQSRLVDAAARTEYLVRVLVDIDRQPADVVTAYRTSKIAKYWREQT